MAVNQQPMQRAVALQGGQVSAGSGLTSLASATSALSQIITEKLTDVAIDQAAIQGQNDVIDDKAPENLAMPFTRATKAYNQAVANTEARRQAISATELIEESLAKNTNPATFNSSSPANLKAELQGIRDGILQHARPETRAQLATAIDSAAANASVAMLKHSINYDNQRIKFDFNHDITGLLEARRNAAIAGDMERVRNIDAALDASVNDYSEMSQEIKQVAPYLRDDIARSREVDTVLSDFSDALHKGTQSQFLSELADNKQGLPYSVWDKAVKGVVAIDQQHSRLKNDVNAEQLAQLDLDIQQNKIQTPQDILFNYPDLTTAQKTVKIKQLNEFQAKQVKDNSKVISAQQNILLGRPSWNSKDTINAMFKEGISRFEQATGKIATLSDMKDSALGLNDFPASGLPGTPVGTNIPALDSYVSQKLTSKDPIETAQAAMVYNDMVKINGMPNSISLSGDALSVAESFANMYIGRTTPEQAAVQAIDTVLNVTEPQMAQRLTMFNRDIAHMDSSGNSVLKNQFKDAFGFSPQEFSSSNAFKIFSDKYMSHYLSSKSKEAALEATKYEMRGFGTSKYYDKGFVGINAPETSVPIAKVANAFDNQMVASLQGIIDRNNAIRELHPELKTPKIEWSDPKQSLTGNISQQDKVFKKLTIGSRPRIKVDGHETDVVLIPSASSRLTERPSYLFGVYDRFNNLIPLKDVSNETNQVATFMPVELSLWAPEVATEQTDKAIRDVASSVLEKESKRVDKSELEELNKKAPTWQVMLGLGGQDEHRKYIEERAKRTPEGRLDSIVDALKNARGDSATRTKISDADAVGISPELIARDK